MSYPIFTSRYLIDLTSSSATDVLHLKGRQKPNLIAPVNTTLYKRGKESAFPKYTVGQIAGKNVLSPHKAIDKFSLLRGFYQAVGESVWKVNVICRVRGAVERARRGRSPLQRWKWLWPSELAGTSPLQRWFKETTYRVLPFANDAF